MIASVQSVPSSAMFTEAFKLLVEYESPSDSSHTIKASVIFDVCHANVERELGIKTVDSKMGKNSVDFDISLDASGLKDIEICNVGVIKVDVCDDSNILHSAKVIMQVTSTAVKGEFKRVIFPLTKNNMANA
eukprot:GDKJ01021748.1.p1 GENE.GDKJ01021748.1~~GDKJ01021748.1.p1  ORF type:complete len:132 (-),score=29.15 GDKJ01021748.1:35-430(-)